MYERHGTETEASERSFGSLPKRSAEPCSIQSFASNPPRKHLLVRQPTPSGGEGCFLFEGVARHIDGGPRALRAHFPASRTRKWRDFDTSSCGPCPREAESLSRFVCPTENSQKNWTSTFLGPSCIRTCRGEERGQDGSASSHAVWRSRRKSCLV